MSRFTKALLLGCLIALCGLIVTVLPIGSNIEEDFGLDLLFKLRGMRKAPEDVVVIGIDKASADKLRLPEKPEKWPRTIHATLIQNLIAEGASVIVFDVSFLDPVSDRDDGILAAAIKKAQTVVLCESLKTVRVPIEGGGGEVDVVRVAPPIPPLAQAAAASAPFPLPKVPIRLSQFWTFKTAAGDKPTLPVVAFQLFAMPVYDTFVSLLEQANPDEGTRLPRSAAVIKSRSIIPVMKNIRDIFKRDRTIADRMISEIERSKPFSVDSKAYKMILSLIHLYQSSSNSQYLNFYGPPHTITTIPYYKVMHVQKGDAAGKGFDLKGKAVFVGLSELWLTDQKEGFYTVFSQIEGQDISGVEIAANAFANLMEDKTVRPLAPFTHIMVILLWGMTLGILCRYLPSSGAALTVAGLSLVYLLTAEYQFRTRGIWFPVVVPVFLLSTLSVTSNVLWNYITSRKDHQKIKKAFEYYMPSEAVNEVLKSIENIKTNVQNVYGICLSTDAERYTGLSETIDPQRLREFLNTYYETIFKPIRKHGGVVSNVVGDAMLAIWVKANPQSLLCNQACLAAIDITKAVQEFNQSMTDALHLPTRIGLHAGEISLGSIGAMDHYEYRPVGDIVNTATRVEGLNKHLGTKILATKEILDGNSNFLTREVGRFLLVGKSTPVTVFELISRAEETTEQQRSVCRLFEEALDAFRSRSWDKAFMIFFETNNISGSDGPSQFYMRLCEKFKEMPPAMTWEGEVYMDRK